MNSIVVTGNLVRDPELRSLPSGSAVANFSVADNRHWADPATGERREATTFVDVVAWGDLGRHIVESLRQGDRVTVFGHLEQRSWQTGQGQRRTKLELTATDVAASLRWASLAVLKPEHGAELSQDEHYEYDIPEEEVVAEAVHPEARQVVPGWSSVARGPLAQTAQQATPGVPPQPGAQATVAQPSSELGR